MYSYCTRVLNRVVLVMLRVGSITDKPAASGNMYYIPHPPRASEPVVLCMFLFSLGLYLKKTMLIVDFYDFDI